MNIFDSLQNTVSSIVSNTFGCIAEWQPSNGQPLQKHTILFKDPTDDHTLSNVDFEIEKGIMEYLKGQFEGLQESVSKGETEIIRITNNSSSIIQYYVRRTETKFDGKTIIAFLTPIE